jgi:integrase
MAKRRARPRGMGNVWQRGPANWAIRWREGTKRRYRDGFPTRELAERVLAKVISDLAAGRAGLAPDVRGAPTLADLAKPWLERRKVTNRAGAEDEGRWKKHLTPAFGHLRAHEVDQGTIRRFVEAKLAEGVNPATIRVLVAILSGLFVELVEDGKAQANPCRALPRSTRRLMRPTHDPRTTPFVEKLADVRRIYLALEEPFNIAYAIGAFAGLRTGEVFALRWENVDLAARRIHVRESVKGPLKDKTSRVAPILATLLPVLREWKLKSGGEGLVVPSLRSDGAKVDKHTPGRRLRAALTSLGLARPGLGWYEATRHTFASQWVMAGGSIEKLKEILGHYSVVVTERYAHLRPDLFPEKDLDALPVDLRPGDAPPAEIGHESGTSPATSTAN